MRDFNKNTEDSLGCKTQHKFNIDPPECITSVQDRKVLPSEKTEKTYKVTVTYIQLTDEEVKIKRAIIESIIKKGYKK